MSGGPLPLQLNLPFSTEPDHLFARGPEIFRRLPCALNRMVARDQRSAASGNAGDVHVVVAQDFDREAVPVIDGDVISEC